jgi:hypothetical protein
MFFFSLHVFGEPAVHFRNFFLCCPSQRSARSQVPSLGGNPPRRLAVSCGLGRHRIRTRDFRTTAWCATIELPRLPIELPRLPIELPRLPENRMLPVTTVITIFKKVSVKQKNLFLNFLIIYFSYQTRHPSHPPV